MARKTRETRSNTLKDEVKPFLLESRMAKVRKYLYEGRRFETLSVGDLRSEWISAFDRCSVSPTAPESRKLVDDLEAEMEVRKIDPPFDEAKEKPRARGAGLAQSFWLFKAPRL
jgi:hypothetical protein